MKTETKSKPTCVFCGRSDGVQFAIFNPRFQPFGTACVECEATLPPDTKVPEPKSERDCMRCEETFTDDGDNEHCPKCRENMNRTDMPAKPEAKPGKWTADAANPPGPIQVNRFNKAHRKLTAEHNTRRELWGVIGGEEHDMSFLSIYGGGQREDVTKALTEIGERHGWTVSKANVNQVIAEFEAALPALMTNRPVDDKRKTKEQAAAEDAEIARLKQEREDLEAALADTAPGFRATIKRLEKATDKAASWIFGLWREYSKTCQGSDQSAVMGEFIQWYQKQLGKPAAVLEAAIAEPELVPLGTVKRNHEHDGVEIAFNDKPSDELRQRLKSAGFRITRRPPWRWYQKYSAHAWAKACELAGVPDGVDSQERWGNSAIAGIGVNSPAMMEARANQDQTGAYVQAQENAYLDRQAEAVGA